MIFISRKDSRLKTYVTPTLHMKVYLMSNLPVSCQCPERFTTKNLCNTYTSYWRCVWCPTRVTVRHRHMWLLQSFHFLKLLLVLVSGLPIRVS